MGAVALRTAGCLGGMTMRLSIPPASRGAGGGLPGRAAGARTSAPGRERAVRDEGERDAAGEIVGDALRIAEASAAFDDAWPEALRCLVEEAMREAEELDCRGMSYAV